MSWTQLRMLGSKVLVRLDARRETLGSIVIPDEHRRQPESGEVIAHGPNVPHEIVVGAHVMFGKWNGSPVESPSHDPTGEYFVMSADHVKRGAKLPVPVMGYTHAPLLPDSYAVVEREPGEDVSEAVSSDVVRRR